ncbi:hypothetical protein UFOVP146_39 [uncultured Caudovirales phage]|uniref:Uncharacterized protein n=1 Tax=uncultured Caudovirales phage TaxID=2100421 RepID=A0A6J7VL04_9CAUD|nr:hypothetical protein UFOVP146_39 [uncultured Caudovirales phage]
MAILFTNNASTTLSASITSGATSLTVATGAGALFPNPTAPDYFLVTLQGISGTPIEIVKCTARSADTFTIVRAQEGTTASAFTGGDKVELRVTAAQMSGAAKSGLASGTITENSTTVTANYTQSTGNNALSVGPISVASGVTYTVPSGQRWLIL